MPWEATFDAPSGLFRQFHDGVRLSPGPMGEDFSGSCPVTSRNPLIHKGATNSTKSERFDVKGVQQGLLSWGWRCVGEPLATANFREFLFFPRTSVNKSRKMRVGLTSAGLRGPRLLEPRPSPLWQLPYSRAHQRRFTGRW